MIDMEKAIKEQPERYVPFRNEVGELCEVHDKDNGYIWKKEKNEWVGVG